MLLYLLTERVRSFWNSNKYDIKKTCILQQSRKEIIEKDKKEIEQR